MRFDVCIPLEVCAILKVKELRTFFFQCYTRTTLGIFAGVFLELLSAAIATFGLPYTKNGAGAVSCGIGASLFQERGCKVQALNPKP